MGDGEDVIEGPLANVERPTTIEATAAIAVEDARAEFFIAEMIGAGPGARLAGRVEEDGMAVYERGKMLRSIFLRASPSRAGTSRSLSASRAHTRVRPYERSNNAVPSRLL